MSSATADRSAGVCATQSLNLGVPISQDEFVISLEISGIFVVCSASQYGAWEEVLMIHAENQWVKNARGVVLASIGRLEHSENFDAITILDWARFITALRVLHNPTPAK